MLYCNKNIKIYHAHIPRTGGRFVKTIFEKNGFECFYHNYAEKICGIEIPHLHYPLYNHYLEADIFPNFSIVRNPIDKIWSAIDIQNKRYPNNNFLSNLEDKSFFIDYINYERSYRSYHNNWFTPQTHFISNKTYTYKLEHKLDFNFTNWINKKIGLNLNEVKERDYVKMKEEVLYPEKNIITEKIKNNIKDYYIEDFRFFDY